MNHFYGLHVLLLILQILLSYSKHTHKLINIEKLICDKGIIVVRLFFLDGNVGGDGKNGVNG